MAELEHLYKMEFGNMFNKSSRMRAQKYLQSSRKKAFVVFLIALAALTFVVLQSKTTQTPMITKPIYIKGVSTMNQSKDRITNPPSFAVKQFLVNEIKKTGATHISIETPYDSPQGGDSLGQTREWISIARSMKLSVIHRHMFLSFEGIYNVPKDPNQDYAEQMKQWMINNADLIQPGDVWVPMPEPQNGGISGVNCDSSKQTCIFPDAKAFNEFIRKITDVSRQTLTQLGKKDVTVSCCGFDGYIVAGLSNPAFAGTSVLEPETVKVLGALAIDHYPQEINGQRPTYAEDLQKIHEVWPNVPIMLTEFGTIDDVNAEPVSQILQDFADDPLVIGVSWFQLGPSEGAETLLSGDLVKTPDTATVKETNNLEELKRGYSSLPTSINK